MGIRVNLLKNTENKSSENVTLLNQFLTLCILTTLLGIFLSACGQPGSVSGGSKKDQPQSTIQPQQQWPPREIAQISPSKTHSKKINVTETNLADVIIVIDNSASMRFEQANMAERFSSLLEEMKGLDWRLGVITTDVSTPNAPKKDGRFLEFHKMPGTFFLSSEMNIETVKAAFAVTIQRPSREGHHREQGIRATYRALERKPEWLRQNSSLNVVVVTDADETPRSTGPDLRNNPTELLKYIKSENPSKSFYFHSIIVKEGDAACLKKDDNESYGRTYAWLSSKTGGVIGDVCQTDYSKQLQMIGQKVSQQIKSIELDCEPLAGSVVVKLPNQELAAGVTVEGREVHLIDALPAGQTQIDYACAVVPN